MVRILIILGTSILGGILYRLGGKEGFNTRYRDIGVPLCICALLGLLGGLNGLWQWLSLFPCFFLQWGALTTYRYFLPKPKDYSWYHYAMHGSFVSLAIFPYSLATGHWIVFGLRVILCTIGLSSWYFIAKWNDDLHEWGRGFILTLTTPLLLLPF